MCVYIYIYVHMALHISATASRGLVRPHGSSLLVFCPPPHHPHKPPKVFQIITKQIPVRKQITAAKSWVVSWGLFWELRGQTRDRYQMVQKNNGSIRNGRSIGTPVFKYFLQVSSVSGHTHLIACFWNLVPEVSSWAGKPRNGLEYH